MVTASPWWSRERHADRRPFLMARNRIKAAIRRDFEEKGFIEVECAALQISPGNETHLHAFATDAVGPTGESTRYYLHTSPEFASKKLLAAGEQRIFDFARVFRNREHAPLNVPEFTMLEWYRTRQPYDAVIGDCLRLLSIAAHAAQRKTLTYRDHTADLDCDPEWLTVADAFTRYAGMDLLATLSKDGEADREALAAQATQAKIAIAADDTWSDIFARVLAERIEPKLGFGRPTILDRYPRVEAALARPCPKDPRVAERFELYVCGVELANGFGELTDPVEQRKRFEAEMAEIQRRYGERYPIDEDLLAALPHMPPTSGVAMGFDRLVMLATGAPHIEQVIWTPPAGRWP
ncbi:MAG: EF-P lysine aminoacylase GenX [Alphaproteobacteria bacterium]|nr:EF-P lysine aminoacylase GenX [Alphaproteobacteria bacterium]